LLLFGVSHANVTHDDVDADDDDDDDDDVDYVTKKGHKKVTKV